MPGRTVKRVSAYFLTGALLFGAAGFSVASGAGASGATKPDTIMISNFMFHPMVLTVRPGTTITVTNKDTVVHTLTATGGQFNTGNISPHKTKTFTAPKKTGTYHYFCAIHQFMMGKLIVRK